ncbi:unnamed protein product [Sympodiomycopsis kandeliae]
MDHCAEAGPSRPSPRPSPRSSPLWRRRDDGHLESESEARDQVRFIRLPNGPQGSGSGRVMIPAVCETDEVSTSPPGRIGDEVDSRQGKLFPRHTDPTSSQHQHSGLLSPRHDDKQSSDAMTNADQRNRAEKQSMSYVIRSGIAGGIAGCVAKTAIAPLDRVKILFQAQNPEFQKYSGHWLGVFRAGSEIVKENGIWALFRGHSATLMRIFPYAAIKYMAYDKLHFLLMPRRELETSSRLFLAGSSSGVLSVFLTYPLELIRVRLAFETKKSKMERGALRRIIRQIYTEGATEAPFSGDARRRAATNTMAGQQQRQFHTSLHSASTSSAATTATAPVPPPSTTAQRTNTLLQSFPIMKFYRGFSVTVLGMIPYAGTSFLVFGRCKRILQDQFGISDTEDAHPSPLHFSKTTIDLTSGAFAGAISQTAAYPFEVIRRRQQVAAIVRPGAMVGMVETVKWIWVTSGFRGFYTGLSIGFLKVVPMTSISFAVWLHMKRSMGI